MPVALAGLPILIAHTPLPPLVTILIAVPTVHTHDPAIMTPVKPVITETPGPVPPLVILEIIAIPALAREVVIATGAVIAVSVTINPPNQLIPLVSGPPAAALSVTLVVARQAPVADA